MDIFGKDFGIWIMLDRYGNINPDNEAISAFMASNDCTEFHLEYILHG